MVNFSDTGSHYPACADERMLITKSPLPSNTIALMSETTDSPDPAPLKQVANDLLAGATTGTLATLSDKHDGFPFASVAPYALLEGSRPLFLFSSLSVHNRNLRRNSNATLLVTEQAVGNLAAGRVSVMGTVEPVAESAVDQARETYLAAHPEAKQWISFHDFTLFQMSVIDSYVVAGFGNMGWVNDLA